MVTGGELSYGVYIDNTEVYDSDLGIWAISGAKLPRPMYGLKATNIDGRVMIFGNCILVITCYHENHNITITMSISSHADTDFVLAGGI